MSDAIIVSIISSSITGLVTLIGTVIKVNSSTVKMLSDLKAELELKFAVSEAVNAERFGNLTGEVRKHNDFATRVPVLEEKVEGLKERIEVIEK